jgi:hypothetical protein
MLKCRLLGYPFCMIAGFIYYFCRLFEWKVFNLTCLD